MSTETDDVNRSGLHKTDGVLRMLPSVRGASRCLLHHADSPSSLNICSGIPNSLEEYTLSVSLRIIGFTHVYAGVQHV